MGLWNSEVIDTGFGAMTTISDPALSAATTTANVDQYTGIIITLTIAGNAQIIGAPTNTTAGKRFTVVNNDTSTDNIDVNGITLEPGEAQGYIWDGSAWIAIEAVDASDITFTPAGDIAATNIQDAIEELDTEKISHNLATAENDFLVGAPTPFGSFIRKTTAQTKAILDWVLTSTSEVIGFTISGGNTPKTLTVDETKALSDKVDKETGYSLMPDSHLTSHPAPTDRDTRNDPAGAASTVQGSLNTHTGNTTDAHGIDEKVDKVPGSSLVADTEIAKIHTQNTDTSLDLGGTNPVTAAELATLRDTTVPAKVDKLILETAEKTADYTLADGDQDKIVLMNKTGAATLTVPTNAAVAFSIGTIIGVYNISSDVVTIAGDAGVIVRNVGNLAQYGEVSLRKRATDEWVLAGVVS